MIEGLVRHDTEMRVEKNFVDSHGQSEVAFTFCHLLGAVRLMPRLKRISTSGFICRKKELWISLALSHAPIRWDLIEQQYDEMVKSTVAIKRGTASTESILRRYNST
jgi:TnpA family transposase